MRGSNSASHAASLTLPHHPTTNEAENKGLKAHQVDITSTQSSTVSSLLSSGVHINPSTPPTATNTQSGNPTNLTPPPLSNRQRKKLERASAKRKSAASGLPSTTKKSKPSATQETPSSTHGKESISGEPTLITPQTLLAVAQLVVPQHQKDAEATATFDAEKFDETFDVEKFDENNYESLSEELEEPRERQPEDAETDFLAGLCVEVDSLPQEGDQIPYAEDHVNLLEDSDKNDEFGDLHEKVDDMIDTKKIFFGAQCEQPEGSASRTALPGSWDSENRFQRSVTPQRFTLASPDSEEEGLQVGECPLSCPSDCKRCTLAATATRDQPLSGHFLPAVNAAPLDKQQLCTQSVMLADRSDEPSAHVPAFDQHQCGHQANYTLAGSPTGPCDHFLGCHANVGATPVFGHNANTGPMQYNSQLDGMHPAYFVRLDAVQAALTSVPAFQVMAVPEEQAMNTAQAQKQNLQAELELAHSQLEENAAMSTYLEQQEQHAFHCERQYAEEFATLQHAFDQQQYLANKFGRKTEEVEFLLQHMRENLVPGAEYEAVNRKVEQLEEGQSQHDSDLCQLREELQTAQTHLNIQQIIHSDEVSSLQSELRATQGENAMLEEAKSENFENFFGCQRCWNQYGS